MKRSAIFLIGAVLISGSFYCCASAQEPEPSKPVLPKEAEAVLAKTADLKSYRAQFTLEAKEENGEMVKLEGNLLFERPNHRRLEIRQGGSKDASQLLVCDGTTEWQYYPASNSVYKSIPMPEALGPHRAFADVKPETIQFIEKTKSDSANLLRFEAVPLPSVVEGSPVPIQKMRVDVAEVDGLVRELNLISDKGEIVLSQKFSAMEINTPIPAGSFAFTPPAGAQVVDLGEPGKPGEKK